MSNSLYSRFLRVCKLWPVDASKEGRDFGAHLRSQVAQLFPNGELTRIEDTCHYERNIAALERLALNSNAKRTNAAQILSKFESATGFKKSELEVLMSTEYLKQNKAQYEKGFVNNLKERLSMKPISPKLIKKAKNL